MELKVLDNKGKENGVIQWHEALLQTKASAHLLHEVVVAYGANQRSGTSSTKTRAHVSGGGVKPWRQKGTGRARAGSIRSPLWRNGGVIFGPHPRDFRIDLPKKKRKQAFKMALKGAIDEDRVQVVEPIEVSEPKTKVVAAIYKKWKVPEKFLLVCEKIEPVLQQASRNIPGISIKDAATLNTYDVLWARKLFITTSAVEQLFARLAPKQ